MIQQETILQVADNSGVKKVMCVKCLAVPKNATLRLVTRSSLPLKKHSLPTVFVMDREKKCITKRFRELLWFGLKKKSVDLTEPISALMTMPLQSSMTKATRKVQGSSDLWLGKLRDKKIYENHFSCSGGALMAAKLAYRGSEPTKFKKTKIKKDDEVLVISGKEKGKKERCLRLINVRTEFTLKV